MKLKALALLACGFLATEAQAQDSTKVYVVQDTSYVHTIPLEELLVTPKKEAKSIQQSSLTLSHGNQVHRLAKESSFTTSIPGINAELQRDLPSLVSYFTPNGMPILTKQTSNNALTPRMPFTLLQPEIQEPNALTSGPDAAIVYKTQYDVQNLLIDPIRQAASISTNNTRGISAAVVLEHDSPEVLEGVIEELDAYAQRMQSIVALRYQTDNTRIEGWTQQSQSNNEFSGLFDVNDYNEEDTMNLVNLVAEHKIQDVKLFAGITRQRANIDRFVEEITKEFRETEDRDSNGYIAGIQKDNNTIRIQYHNITRAIDDTSANINNVQIILERSQQVRENVRMQAMLRTDTHNQKTHLSASAHGYIQATRKLSIDLYAATLYDPIVNLSMSSSLRDDRNLSKPTQTTYYQTLLKYKANQTKMSVSAMYKDIDFSWYANKASITGFLLRAAASRTIEFSGDRAFRTKIATTKRWLELSHQNNTEQMPGPAQIQTSAVVTYAHPKYSVQIDGHIHGNRTQGIDKDRTASLGKLVLLNVGATMNFGSVNVGISAGNLLGGIHENNMFAYEAYDTQGNQSIKIAPLPPIVPQISFRANW